jgi:secondary thiamine-phosphate synthase enzyme
MSIAAAFSTSESPDPSWAHSPGAWHALIRASSSRTTEFIDLTDRVAALLASQPVETGLVHLQVLHTTAALVLNEHEPLLLADFADALDRLMPADILYRHDQLGLRTVNVTLDERVNGHAHCRALLLGASLTLHVAARRLVLGRWQRLFLVELDGPRDRTVSVVVLGNDLRAARRLPRRRRRPVVRGEAGR